MKSVPGAVATGLSFIHMSARRTFLLPLLISIVASSAHAKAWRGIEPWQSTHADVVRTLNQCSDPIEACVFTIDKEDAYILFYEGLTAEDSPCTEPPPLGTVMFIETRPHSAATFADFQFQKREFVQSSLLAYFGYKRPRRYRLYVNAKDGLALKTLTEKVAQAVYLPPASEIRRCRQFYEPPESFVSVYQGHVPVISLDCPKEVFEDHPIVLTATSDFATRRGFEWIVSDGRIAAGQHTVSVKVDTTGLAGKTIQIGAEVQDYDLGLIGTSTCNVSVLKKPQ